MYKHRGKKKFIVTFKINERIQQRIRGAVYRSERIYTTRTIDKRKKKPVALKSIRVLRRCRTVKCEKRDREKRWNTRKRVISFEHHAKTLPFRAQRQTTNNFYNIVEFHALLRRRTGFRTDGEKKKKKKIGERTRPSKSSEKVRRENPVVDFGREVSVSPRAAPPSWLTNRRASPPPPPQTVVQYTLLCAGNRRPILLSIWPCVPVRNACYNIR